MYQECDRRFRRHTQFVRKAVDQLLVRFIAEEISKNTYVNIMDQYRPCYQAGQHPPLDRRITAREFRDAVDCARKAGLRRLDGITTG